MLGNGDIFDVFAGSKYWLDRITCLYILRCDYIRIIDIDIVSSLFQTQVFVGDP